MSKSHLTYITDFLTEDLRVKRTCPSWCFCFCAPLQLLRLKETRPVHLYKTLLILQDQELIICLSWTPDYISVRHLLKFSTSFLFQMAMVWEVPVKSHWFLETHIHTHIHNSAWCPSHLNVLFSLKKWYHGPKSWPLLASIVSVVINVRWWFDKSNWFLVVLA